MKKVFTCALALCLFVNGCYFNSAGHLFTKAAYDASANSADTQLGKFVYMYGDEYFIELPRYRQGKKILTQYNAFSDDKRTVGPQPTGEVSMFRIPADFAMFLTGRADAPSTPSYMVPVNNADEVKRGTCMTITKQGASFTSEFKYSSPNAVWWYTAGVFEWLCVDLPVTITENAIAISGLAALAVLNRLYGNSTSSKSKSATPATPDSTASYKEEFKVPSDLLEFNYKYGTYDMKPEADARYEKILEVVIGERFLSKDGEYLTATEAEFIKEYVRALRLQSQRYKELGYPDLEISSEMLADSVESNLEKWPVR